MPNNKRPEHMEPKRIRKVVKVILILFAVGLTGVALRAASAEHDEPERDNPFFIQPRKAPAKRSAGHIRDSDHHHRYDRDSKDRLHSTPYADRRKDNDYYDRNRDYEYRHPGHRPHGYHRHPRGRSLGPARFGHKHRYHYEGHWNSWEHWERYKRRHPDRYRHGRYYHENGHLFFGFCDPNSASCFYFSIGS